MNFIFQMLGEVWKWSAQDPRNARMLMQMLRVAAQSYQRLTPSQKQKVDRILWEGGRKLAHLALGDVLDWAKLEAVQHGLNADAGQVIKDTLKRAGDIGIDAAVRELKS